MGYYVDGDTSTCGDENNEEDTLNVVDPTVKVPVGLWIPPVTSATANASSSSASSSDSSEGNCTAVPCLSGSIIPAPPPPPPTPPPLDNYRNSRSGLFISSNANDAVEKPGMWANWSLSANPAPIQIGFTGLDNLGNTCFMNSVIQCLSNTEELRDYFLSNQFKEDINESNPLGSGGKMAISFVVLFKHLWSGQHHSYSPSKLKALMGEKMSQFSGFAQHDAQEYMAYLLDALHEDVNRVKVKPYVEMSSGSSDSEEEDDHAIKDEELADDSWRKYRMRNDSVIVDLFQGQYKSKLVCPKCSKVSITFDPFLYLSIPLPKNHVLHSVFYFPLDNQRKPIRYLVKLPPDCKVMKLLETVSSRAKVDAANLQSIFVRDGLIREYLTPQSPMPVLSKNNPSEMLLIFEVLNKHQVNENVKQFVIHQQLSVPQRASKCSRCLKTPEIGPLKRCTKCYRSSYCSHACQRLDWNDHKKFCRQQPEPVGSPFLISLPQSKCEPQLLNQLSYELSRHSVDISLPENRNGSTSASGDDDSGFDNDSVDNIQLPKHKFSLKCYNSNEEESMQLEDLVNACKELPDRIPLIMEWMNNEKDALIVETKDLDHSYDILEADRVHNERIDVTLDECLRLFAEPEILSPQEAWYCPRCKQHREATKQLSLWRLPTILVIQLKRFSFKNLMFRDKIDKFVRFPIHGLNLAPFCCPNRRSCTQRPIYDLYAVINHYGGMFGGHYTAFAKTTHNGKPLGWRLFDDSRVEEISEENVVTKNAYILFYRLREEDSDY